MKKIMAMWLGLAMIFMMTGLVLADYRQDSDLEFLKYCENDDLEFLIKYLTSDKDGNERLSEWLTYEKRYEEHYPNHKQYWDLIAAELQLYGGNTIANRLRGGKGVLYKEILTDVCDKLNVHYNYDSSIDDIEANLLQKILDDSLRKMTEKEIRELESQEEFKISKSTVLRQLIKRSGFTPYKMSVIVANGVAKSLIGRGLSFSANAALTKAIGVFAGPVGMIIPIWNVASPAYRVTIPAVIQVAYMRQKYNAEYYNT